MKKVAFLTLLLTFGLAVIFVMPAKAPPPTSVPSPPTETIVVNDDTNPVPVNVSTVYRFAGYSDDPTTGNAGGIIGMHSICQETFGSDARMCTSEEFWRSPAIAPPAPASASWIQPSFIAFAFTGMGSAVEERHCMYFNGVILSACSPIVTSCGQWRFDNSLWKGTVTTTDEGQVLLAACDNSLRVACCLPASQSP